MDKREQFRAAAEKEMTAMLATAQEGRVTMRVVSPVYYEGAVLIFTAPASKKYAQLRANPRCCLAIGPFFAEAAAEFCGATMAPENAALREAYRVKFAGAFAEGDDFGGRNDEFLLLRPTRLSGWAFPDGALTGDGIPTVSFEIALE